MDGQPPRSTAEAEAAGVNVSAMMTCYSATKGPDFAGVVRLYVSLNGVEFSDTGLTFTYFRAPVISQHTPHGGALTLTLTLTLTLPLALTLTLTPTLTLTLTLTPTPTLTLTLTLTPTPTLTLT